MRILGVDHTSITTGDLDSLVAFYTRHAGFVEFRRFDATDAGVRIAELISPRGEMLEILQPLGQASVKGAIAHIAFAVEGIQEAFDEMKNVQGIKMVHAAPQVHGEMRFFFIQTPNGEYVEFIEKKRPE